ncbi:MAG: helicase [Planctomycetes bacterium]|nr:helicase [Planctomycetota bacterium]
MAGLSHHIPTQGQIVRVRQRTYLVENLDLRASGTDAVVGLACVDDDAQGQQLQVLWNHELDAEILSGEAWESVAARGFDEPRLFAAYLHTLRWNCVTSTDARLFQSPFRAGIHLDAYQLEPLRKALVLPRCNLFIADDVGLGKTIEAGLIARELLLRKKAKEIIVSCPPSMLIQWQDELEARFGLTFEILDKDYVTRVRRERGFAVNPWGTHSRLLISQRLLIDEAYAGPLRDWLLDFRPGTLLILDEAHHAAPSSGQKYAIDSKITRAVRDIAPRFEHRLFLSATPHNGHSNSFSALLEILDPQRFCRGVPVTKKVLDDVMVRRIKDDIREVQGGFPKREVVQIDIDKLTSDAPDLKLFALLDEYRRLREERLKSETKRKQASAGLLITGLQQRLLSSIEAFARTLRVHRKTVLRQWDASKMGTEPERAPAGIFDLVTDTLGSDDDRAALPEAELQAEEDAQIEAISAATAGPLTGKAASDLFAQEQKLLDEMTNLAESARGRPDARVTRLIAWIREKMCPGLPATHSGTPSDAKWNNIRILIFTEYEDTKRYLHQQISAAIEGTDRAAERIAVYCGSTPAHRSDQSGGVPTREDIKQAFNANPAKHPLRILIATDAAREGLNLQAHCWNLFHFDVPWNPSRMEQRNGRIDRKLQPSDKVFCHYFFYKQRPEDRILQVLVRKTELIKRELGSLSQVIDARLTATLKQGIRRDRIAEMEREIDEADLEKERRKTVEDELEAARERQDALRAQIDRLRTRLADSEKHIGLSEDQFRSAISCALELMGTEPLQSTKTPEGPTRYHFPTLDQRQGADPTWSETMDTLRTPRNRDQKFWEWRRESPIRPVVFEDRGVIDDETVHLHLEQRVVQRLLRRFTAQGFVHHDLSRACLAHATDAIPRVVLLGRLCLYGPNAARLHEEIVPITARWTDPKVRKVSLAPYGRDAETKTLELLDTSLVPKANRAVNATIQSQLQAGAPRDIEDLLPHLDTRAREYAKDAERKLGERADAEAKAMREILENQKKHIAVTASKYDGYDATQLKFEFGDDESELRQLETNRKYWTKRLLSIETELKTEPDRIRELYQVKATRIEPVGLVYLWPVTG